MSELRDSKYETTSLLCHYKCCYSTRSSGEGLSATRPEYQWEKEAWSRNWINIIFHHLFSSGKDPVHISENCFLLFCCLVIKCLILLKNQDQNSLSWLNFTAPNQITFHYKEKLKVHQQFKFWLIYWNIIISKDKHSILNFWYFQYLMVSLYIKYTYHLHLLLFLEFQSYVSI